MKQRGTILDATLFVYFSDDSGVDCKYALTANLAGEAYLAGIPLSAGTDDEPGDNHDNFSALSQELILLVDGAGLTTVDAIGAATLNGTRTIGREWDVGSIEVGEKADCVILDQDPLRDIRNVRSVYATIKNGIVYKCSEYRPIGVPRCSRAG